MKALKSAVIIGSGNLAEALARAIAASDLELRQLYARNEARGRAIAALTGTETASRPEELCTTADLYLIAVSDSAVGEVARTLPIPSGAVVAHTAGSVSLEALPEQYSRRAVFYPMQTFTKGRAVDFRAIPIFVEAADAALQADVEAFARHLSQTVLQADSARRAKVHLAAVFACNFANRCYGMAAEILERRGIPFDVMLPLIDETARKVHYMSPREAQTGPAVRYDAGVIVAQSALLAGRPDLRRIYDAMSESIHNAAVEADK